MKEATTDVPPDPSHNSDKAGGGTATQELIAGAPKQKAVCACARVRACALSFACACVSACESACVRACAVTPPPHACFLCDCLLPTNTRTWTLARASPYLLHHTYLAACCLLPASSSLPPASYERVYVDAWLRTFYFLLSTFSSLLSHRCVPGRGFFLLLTF